MTPVDRSESRRHSKPSTAWMLWQSAHGWVYRVFKCKLLSYLKSKTPVDRSESRRHSKPSTAWMLWQSAHGWVYRVF